VRLGDPAQARTLRSSNSQFKVSLRVIQGPGGATHNEMTRHPSSRGAERRSDPRCYGGDCFTYPAGSTGAPEKASEARSPCWPQGQYDRLVSLVGPGAFPGPTLAPRCGAVQVSNPRSHLETASPRAASGQAVANHTPPAPHRSRGRCRSDRLRIAASGALAQLLLCDRMDGAEAASVGRFVF